MEGCRGSDGSPTPTREGKGGGRVRMNGWEERGWKLAGHSGKNDYTKLEKLLARKEKKRWRP